MFKVGSLYKHINDPFNELKCVYFNESDVVFTWTHQGKERVRHVLTEVRRFYKEYIPPKRTVAYVNVFKDNDGEIVFGGIRKGITKEVAERDGKLWPSYHGTMEIVYEE